MRCNEGVILSIKNLSIRIDDEMLDKLHFVADYEARSANGQIIVLIRECIEKYEEKFGEIELGNKPKPKTKSDIFR